MARKKKETDESPEQRLEQLLEELKAAFSNLFQHVTLGAAKPAAAAEEVEEAEETEETEETSEEEVDFPDAKGIKKMKKAQMLALAKQINLTTDDLDEDEIRKLLTTVANITSGEEEDLDAEDVTELCKALDITPKKKNEDNVEALKEYFSGEAEEETEEAEEEDETEAEETEEEEEGSETEGEAPAEDDVDREEVAKSADLPDMATMKEQLEAYNEAAGEDDQIEVETGKVKAAYRKLIEKMVDSGGDIAEWGEPYIYNNEVCCCGLGLDEHTVKGEKGQFGKCLVTGKIFKVGEDGEAIEYKPKKAKK